MTGTDHGDIHMIHPVKCLQHIRFKGSYDIIIIIFQRPLIILLFADGVGYHLLQAVMRAKGITGHQNLFLFDKCIHGVRPVQVRNMQEMKRPVPDHHRLFVFYRKPCKIPVHDLAQKSEGAGSCQNLHLRTVVKKPFHAACMVRLRMAHYQIIDGCHIDHFLQIFQIFLKKPFFYGLKQDRLVPCLHRIGIIGCTRLRVHDNIKYTQFGIHDSGPVETVSQLYCLHGAPPSS